MINRQTVEIGIFGRPRQINEFKFMIEAFKIYLGYTVTLKDLDVKQRHSDIDFQIKLLENIPQMILVLYESFLMKETIRAD